MSHPDALNSLRCLVGLLAEGPLSYLTTAADEAKQNPVPRPLTVGYLEYEQILADTFQDIRNGADPKQALDTAATRIQSEMGKYQ